MIFVVDSTDLERLVEARDELFRLLSERDLQGCTVLVLANKQDSPRALRTDEIRRRLQLPDPDASGVIFVNGHQCNVMPIVGASGEGVEVAMSWLLAHTSAKRVKTAPKNASKR